MTWTFEIDRPMPTRNDRLVNVPPHHHKYRRVRNQWAGSIALAMIVAKIPKATGPRRITLTRIYTGRQRLLDERGCDDKILLDAMKRVIGHRKIGRLMVEVPGAGLIVDDGPGMVVSEIRQVKGDGVPRVLVTVEDIEQPASPARSA